MQSKICILGAGAVGLQLGGRLARAGHEIIFVTHRPETARAIRRRGIALCDPATGRRFERVAVGAVGDLRSAGPLAGHPLLLCVRAGQSAPLIPMLAAAAPHCLPVCCQNGVWGEAELMAHFNTVIGLVLRQTCTLADDTTVLATGRGRLILGRYPSGADTRVQGLARRFESAGFDVGLSERIVEDKWLKLFFNLTSAVNALVRRADHTRPAFVELKVRLLEEARDVFAAAGIRAHSGDGRDRPLEAEIEAQRAALTDGTSARSLPLYNSVWAALHRPDAPLEADTHHALILKLAADHRLSAPTHAVLLHALRACRECGAAPQSLRAVDLLAQSQRARREPTCPNCARKRAARYWLR